MLAIHEDLMNIATTLYGIRLKVGQGYLDEYALDGQVRIMDSLRSSAFLIEAITSDINAIYTIKKENNGENN